MPISQYMVSFIISLWGLVFTIIQWSLTALMALSLNRFDFKRPNFNRSY